ncbi:MAG: UvrD-helicase domain-containing protein [Coriobacteriia bacterium]|nr:UvrD-helicase domain-containing protein [Coriobacteriia bacterium]
MAVKYTPEQEKCVECLIGPVDVSAGAGSGKTFTLTQRIAHALVEPGTGVDDIDQICAITFTEKAAAELKGRVRSTLRAQGLFDQAGKVDDAWISTIHGMCSRILHASALDLGLDPKFQVLGEKEGEELLAAAVDAVLSEQKEQGADDFTLLMREYPFYASMNEPCLSGLLAQMISTASGLPGGFDDLVACQKREQPSALAKRLLLAFGDLQAAYATLKPGKTNDKAQQDIEQGIQALEEYLASGSQDLGDLTKALDQCVVVRKCGTAVQKEACDECRAEHYAVLADFAMLRGGLLLEQLIALARKADAAFTQMKRDSAMLDNNDLIRETLRALDLPQIHDRFKDKFRLVMVDEFQDTDAMQIAIVKHLCGPDMRYLCTVGDAQQSIYGFRGADVAVYRAHQRSLDDPQLQEQASPSKLMLSRNFRSHGDVLAFVKQVCQQKRVFGDGFLDLAAVYDGAGYKAPEPRIQLELISTPAGAKAKEEARRQAQARRIADYFQRMHEGGHALSDMVLLLGSTTHADMYAQAVRNLGFDCIIAGGSLFARAPEVQAAAILLGAVANPRDGQLAFQALTCPAFALSAADLLQLGTFVDEETLRPGRRSLGGGLRQLARELKEGVVLSPALEHAVQVMAKAQAGLRLRPLHEVLLGVLLDSGWVARLQARGAEGAAVLGNLMKAVRMVRQLEEDTTLGPVSIARRFRAQVEEGMKEAPGALNAQGQDAVRIMTIHASKGLEFPVVALAEFDRAPREGALVVRRVGEHTYATLKPATRKVAGKDSPEGAALKAVREQVDLWRGEEPVSEAMLQDADAGTFRGLLVAEAQQAEREEAQRLFYVGATRAKEALCVFMTVKESKSNPEGPYGGLIGDIRAALFGAEEFPWESTTVEYGGSEPALFTVTPVDGEASVDPATDLTAGESNPASAAGMAGPGAEQILLPQVMPLQVLDAHLQEKDDAGLFSYSSIASAAHAKGDDATFGAVDGMADLEIGASDAAASEGSSDEAVVANPSDQDLRPWEELAAAPMGFRDEEEGDAPDSFNVAPTADADKATEFGSALHRLCQLAALAGPEAARAQVVPACRTYGVADRSRLAAALERWLGSTVYARARQFARVQPELPFCLQVEAESGESDSRAGVLQGEIDLLCTAAPGQAAGGPALVVDYKTGGHAGETSEQLKKKHALQAQCYALAVLSGGQESVELVFARVERDDPAGEDSLQTVCYAFDQADVPELRRIVSEQAVRAGAI